MVAQMSTTRLKHGMHKTSTRTHGMLPTMNHGAVNATTRAVGGHGSQVGASGHRCNGSFALVVVRGVGFDHHFQRLERGVMATNCVNSNS